MLDFHSLFAGIGGFELGLERAGMACVGQTEVIEHRRRILARHFPHTPQFGDIRDLTGADLGTADVVTAGFPCKDLSRGKGHRRGLQGEHSGLFYEIIRVVAERLALGGGPRWLVLENTAGLLTSNEGRDMACVVDALVQLGYGVAYRVVDGRFLGTPQRRRRVVLVAHRGGDPRPAWAVLGDEGPGREAAAAHQERRGPREGGPRAVGSPDDSGGLLVWRKSARARTSIDEGGYETWVPAEFGNTLTGNDKGGPLRQTHLVWHPEERRLRTLTITEWERLSGFPDGWTEGIPMGERWGTLGDCFQPTVAEWLGRRMVAVEKALVAHPTLFDDLDRAVAEEPVEVAGQLALFG